ncbi:MAG: 1-(5-phosphoribosyl)-5-[(5-phosphoribosylamino)methylideneamino] imidazole-4-carboxamide isomerase [Candidatus Limnocylindrales bacterium]
MLTRQSGEGKSRAEFQLLPAIDLRDGFAVRLQRGDFSRETVFSDDPAAVARGFIDGGAHWLHVVDLDGARLGVPSNPAAIRAITDAAGSRASVEIAGGLRTRGGVEDALELGATRVVVGTSALADPAFAAELVDAHGAERVVVSLDVRDGLAVGLGWRPGAPGIALAEAMSGLLAVGVRWFEVTAIARDGMLSGPDLGLLDQAMQDPRARVIAAGGIAARAHVEALQAIGCAGAIVGRALYDGTMDLADALEACGQRRIV